MITISLCDTQFKKVSWSQCIKFREHRTAIGAKLGLVAVVIAVNLMNTVQLLVQNYT